MQGPDVPVELDRGSEPEELALVRRLIADNWPPGGRDGGPGVLGDLLKHSRTPLTPEEERALFRRLNYVTFQAEAIRCSLENSRDKLRRSQTLTQVEAEGADIRRRIAESSLRLVVSIAHRFCRGAAGLEELVSDGLLILLGAIDKFDVSRGFRFSTYATSAVQHHYSRVTQRALRYSERFELVPGDMMATATEAPEVGAEPPVDHETLCLRLMENAKEQLTERETSVLYRRFGIGGHSETLTLRETAAEMGLSKERVRQIETSALEKLRRVAEQSDLGERFD